MNRKIIENVFDEVISNMTVKCGRVSTRASVERAFNGVAEKYGLKVTKHEVSGEFKGINDALSYDIKYSLYDKEHNTRLDFTEKFLDDNFIAFTRQGNHKNHTISLDEIIEGYLKLPDINKDNVNQVLFKYLGDGSDTNVLASSTLIGDDFLNVINMPSYYFQKYDALGDGWDNYDFVMAHESMHCIDFIQFNNEEYNIIKKYMNDNGSLTPSEYKKVYHYLFGANDYTMLKTTEYMGAFGKNLDYLGWEKVEESRVERLNKASDYGATKFSEDFAEAGAMVINGFHNPDNPKAVVRWNNETMQYREWIKLHPYKAQYFVKEIYGEDVSIDYLLGQGVNTIRNLLPTDD